MNDYDVSITQISECTFPTPLKFAGRDPSAAIRYRQDADRVRVFPCLRLGEDDGQDATFERAGPREFITGDPSQMTAAILTCGGLCPG